MSPVIHMDTEQARAVARQLDQVSAEIEQEIASLTARIRSLNWQSPSRDGFVGDFAAWQKKIQACAEWGAALGLRVQREVDEWLQVDQDGARRVVSSPGFWDDMKASIRDTFSLIVPYTLQEGFEKLNTTAAGKELIDYATAHKIKIVIKGDGTYGYQGEDARVVEIDWGGGVGGARYGDGKIFVDDDLLQRIMYSPSTLALIIGHELQHAVDDQTGLMTDTVSDEQLKNYGNLTPEQQEDLRRNLANDIETHVDSEIRAYERSDAIKNNSSYRDDGVNTAQERRDILNHNLDSGNYESMYEKSLGDAYPGLEFDVYLDQNGELQVNIIQVVPPPVPVPTPVPPTR